jgi:threonine synthase
VKATFTQPAGQLPIDTGVISRYKSWLPVTDATPIVSLNEGSTPLIYSPWLSSIAGRGARVYLKYEGLNPTGSFKDRGMTMAISKAAERGAKAVICASTGNTSAAAAAYAARAGLRCAVLLPAGKIAAGKLLQAYIYGATTIAIRGNFDDALRLVREFSARGEFEIVNSINPFRIQGQKTAAFEIVEALGDAPDVHILPVGNAGNITAYWLGYREFHQAGRAARLPRMLGIQADGAAPIYFDRVFESPETIASAIRIGNPASWEGARAALRESGGAIEIVSDAEIVHAQKLLASHEGIFVEPASAASVAGFLKCHGAARCVACPFHSLPEDASVVLTVTGHGLKDPGTPAARDMNFPEVDANLDAVLAALDL